MRNLVALRAAMGRLAAVTAVALVALGVGAAPAFAQVKVNADNVGASGATITFDADAESATAGIDGLRTFLPPGIAPAGITLGSAPKGWRLARTADGFTVSGPALRPRQAAHYSVVIKRLPAGVQRFSLKTVQHYADGRVARYVDETGAGGAATAAPVLDLNPPRPVIEAINEDPGFFGAFSKQTYVLGGTAAVLLIGFVWYRSRLA